MGLHPHFSSSFSWGQATIPKSLLSTSDQSSFCRVEILSWKIAKTSYQGLVESPGKWGSSPQIPSGRGLLSEASWEDPFKGYLFVSVHIYF